MAKLINDPVRQDDLIEFLDTSSGFGFELTCVEELSSLGFCCQHGGSYADPVTQKIRQFDIRAQRDDRQHLFRIRCAIECKNLTTAFPMLVMCVPRAPEESFHELIYSFDDKNAPEAGRNILPAYRKVCHAIRLDNHRSAYRNREPVGKSVVQVGRAKDGAIVANDAEVFEKWSQALASANDLADAAAWDGEHGKTIS